jgi:hypothetical protein
MTTTKNEIFEPEVLAALGSVFDETWKVLAAEPYLVDITTRERARLRLAGILIELAKLGQLNSEEMKAAAIRIFSRGGPRRSANGDASALNATLSGDQGSAGSTRRYGSDPLKSASASRASSRPS